MAYDADGVWMPVFLRTPFNYDKDAVSRETSLVCPEPTMAQQQFKEECDINTIVERFGLTGKMPDTPRVPMYGDFTEARDYRGYIEMVRAADAAFMEFPAAVRARFENDPQKLMEFVADPANLAEARTLGIANAAPLTPPPAAAAAPTPSPAAPTT